jgi:glycosyltransferase involved in cell wall biosynthesis
MNILFLEPFFHGSNKAFLEGLCQHSRHNIFPLTVTLHSSLWKSFGLSITLAQRMKSIPETFDLVVASNQTNLTGFLSLTSPRFAATPVVLYMHDNLFTEPLPPGRERNLSNAYISYLSALAADAVVFNSYFHKDAFFETVPAYFREFPEYQPQTSLPDLLKRSTVIHPGLNLKPHDQFRNARKSNKVPVILWNQRWDYEKDPAAFFRIMNRLDDAGFAFELILAGDNRGERPPEFEKAMQRYGNRIRHIGFVDDFQSYSKLLHTADYVVSTSRHEFFPGSILEAIYCGCHPFLPDSLTYPELVGGGLRRPLLHAQVMYRSEDELFEHIRAVLRGEKRGLPLPSLEKISRPFDWSRQIHKFDDFFEEVVATPLS